MTDPGGSPYSIDMRAIGFVAMMCACGRPSEPAIDAPPPPPDIAVDAASPPDAPGDPRVLQKAAFWTESVPATPAQALAFGLDLDGDAVVDNQLGTALATLVTHGIGSQPTVTTAIDRGEIIMLIALFSEFGPNPPLPVTFTLFRGANPAPPACASPTDTVCRRHLDSGTMFQIAANSAHDTPLVGTQVAGVIVTGPGHLQLVTSLFGSAPLALDLVGARVTLRAAYLGPVATGVVAGGITATDLDTKVYPAVGAAAMAAVTRDCATPTALDCGCVAGTTGQAWISLADVAPRDCAITVEEVKTNPLFESLLAPDVVLERQPALSIGVQFTANQVKF